MIKIDLFCLLSFCFSHIKIFINIHFLQSLMKFIKEIVKHLKPDDEIFLKVDEFLKKINKEIKKKKVKAVAIAGGSVAKATFIKGDHDIDIFVKFNYKEYLEKDISKILGNVLKSFKAELVHGSRDYFHIKNNLKFEVVPVLDVSRPEKAVNVTDMSPLHITWVRKYPKFTDDIRLAKQFCKAQEIYGAESYIKGFSGHVLDILVIYYKGFINLLKASNKWKRYGVIDFYNFHKGKALKQLNKSKISPLIVIDPILPERNAAAALSQEKIDILKKNAKEFLRKPSKKFFIRKRITIKELKERTNKKQKKLILVKIIPLKGKEDIIGGKLLKSFTYLKKQIILNEFSLIESRWEWNKEALFYFILKNEVLSKQVERTGPPLKSKKNVQRFKKKHKKTFIKKKRIYTNIKRAYRKVDNLINDLIKDNYIKERVKKIKIICV